MRRWGGGGSQEIPSISKLQFNRKLGRFGRGVSCVFLFLTFPKNYMIYSVLTGSQPVEWRGGGGGGEEKSREESESRFCTE